MYDVQAIVYALYLFNYCYRKTKLTELNRSLIIAFADNITTLGNFKEKVIETTMELIQASKEIKLIIGKEKKTYMKVSR